MYPIEKKASKDKNFKNVLYRISWQDKREDAKIMNIWDKYYEESRENWRTFDYKENTDSDKKWLKYEKKVLERRKSNRKAGNFVNCLKLRKVEPYKYTEQLPEGVNIPTK
jgi:hypothetical protein